jgi:hypothetical protein
LWTIHSSNEGGFRKRTFVTEQGDVSEVETPPGPQFVRRFLGNDVFSNVELVSFAWVDSPGELDPRVLLEFPHLKIVMLRGSQVTDEWLNYVVQIPELHGLALDGDTEGLSPAALAKLRSLEKLRWIRLEGAWVTDESLASIATLEQLQQLSLSSPKVSSASFASIGQLHELRQLDLNRMKQLGDEGTEHLRNLAKLQWLRITGTSTSDGTLANLATLPELEYINLAYTNVGDAGMEHLARLPRLDHLDIGSTEVTDAGLAALARVPKLHYLRVAWLDITDAGTVSLARMERLDTLDAALTLITDEGLVNLKGLKRLRRLHLGPHVTDEAAVELRKALPHCDVGVTSQQRE